MRIAIAALVGVMLAGGASVSAVQLTNASQKDVVVKDLYRYGSK